MAAGLCIVTQLKATDSVLQVLEQNLPQVQCKKQLGSVFLFYLALIIAFTVVQLSLSNHNSAWLLLGLHLAIVCKRHFMR